MKSPFRSAFKVTQEFGVNADYYKRFGLKGHDLLNAIQKAIIFGNSRRNSHSAPSELAPRNQINLVRNSIHEPDAEKVVDLLHKFAPIKSKPTSLTTRGDRFSAFVGPLIQASGFHINGLPVPLNIEGRSVWLENTTKEVASKFFPMSALTSFCKAPRTSISEVTSSLGILSQVISSLNTALGTISRFRMVIINPRLSNVFMTKYT